MIKRILSVLTIITLMAAPAMAGKLTVSSTNHGQFTDLKLTGFDSSSVTGNEATISARTLDQTSATGAVPVTIFDQDDTDYAAIGFECTDTVIGDTCSHHITTTSAKAGSIKILVNGETKYLWYYEDSN